MSKSVRVRAVVLFVFAATLISLGVLKFGRDAEARRQAAMAASVSSAMTAALAPGGDLTNNGLVNPGDTVRYTATITNGAAAAPGNDAANTIFTDTLPQDMTLVGGSLKAAPIAADDTFPVTGNVRMTQGVGSLLANDFNPLNNSSAGFAITVLAGSNTTPFAGTTAQGGNITATTGDGSFQYNPPVGYEGADSFTYTVTDTATGLTGVGTVTFNVSGMFWFIKNDAPSCTTIAAGCGRLANPFSDFLSFSNANVGGGSNPDNNDNIFIYTTGIDYTGGLLVRTGQKLIGQGASSPLTGAGSITGITPAPGSDPLPVTTAGTRPQLTSSTSGLVVQQNNTVRGITIGNVGPQANAFKFGGANFGTLVVGNSAVPDVQLTGTGRALDLTAGIIDPTSGIISVGSTNSAAHGINLLQLAGTLDLGATTISGSTTQGILVNQSTANINFGNTSVTGGSIGVSLQNNSAGTRTFGTLSLSGASGSAFLCAAGGGNTTITGTSNISSTGNPIDIQSMANGTAVNFATTSVNKSTAGGAGLNWGGTNTGATLSFVSLSLTTGNGPGIIAAGGGTINVTGGNIDSTGSAAQTSPAISSNGVTLAATFSTVNSINSGSGGNGVLLVNTPGSLTMNGGFINGASGDSFVVSGTTTSTANITYNGTISTAGPALRPVNISGKTGGIVSFGGFIQSFNNGVLLNINTGATITFRGGLSLSTSANTAFTATGGGTVNVCDTNNCAGGSAVVNTITTTTGQALDVSNTTIGAGGMTFRSIAAGAGTNNGITLDNTGAGTFTVTGNGGACTSVATCTGGAIQGKAGTDGNTSQGIGIYLNNVLGAVSLTRMDVEGCQNYGIRGITVTGGLTIDNSRVGVTAKNGTGVAGVDQEPVTLTPGEASMRFRNLTGTATITNSSFDQGIGRTIFIHNSTPGSALNLNVSNSTLSQTLNNANGGDASGGSTDAITLQGISTATMNATFTTVQFPAYRQFAVLTDARDTATMSIEVNGCTFSNSNTGNANASAALNFGGSGSPGNDVFVKYNVHDSTFRHGSGGTTPNNGGAQIVSGGVSGGVKMDGRIVNNVMGVSGVPFSGAGNAADALRLFASGDNANTTRISGSTHTRYLVQNNIIQRYGEAGIQMNARQGNSTIDATVVGNTIREPGTAALGAFAAIWVNSGALAADTNVVNIAIGGTAAGQKNTMQDSDPNNATDVFLDSNTNAGAACFINLYRNGATNNVGTGETLVRNILNEDNNPLLDLLAGFTNANAARPIGIVAGLPPQPTVAPPADDTASRLYGDTGAALGDRASMNTAAVESVDVPALALGGSASSLEVVYSPIEVPAVATDAEAGHGVFAQILGLISPTVYAQEIVPAAPAFGETVTVNGGSAAGFTIPAGKTVTIFFDATVKPVGVISPTVFSVSNQGSTSGTGFGPILTDGDPAAGIQPTVTTIVQPETITKAFSPSTIVLNGQSTLTFTIRNQNPATAANGITFTDVFPTTPGQMTVAVVPVAANNTCGGALQDSAGGALGVGDVGIKLVGGALAASPGQPGTVSTCTISVKVTAAMGGTYNNTSQAISSTEGAVGLASNTAPLTVSIFTASGVTVSGRVLSSDGRGITNARVVLTDAVGVSTVAVTGRRGGYRFDDVAPGQTYSVTVNSRRFTFTPRMITVTDELLDVDFVAEAVTR